MALARRERVKEILQMVHDAAPFSDGVTARQVLAKCMKLVEDKWSGIAEDPNAHLAPVSDGRMYPPHDRFEFLSGAPRVRAFRQIAHRTFFGDNGALLIERLDGTVEVDLAGADGAKISQLRLEVKIEAR